MNRDQIISELWHCGKLNAAIRKMEPVDLQDDLRQEMFHEICRMDESKLFDLHQRGKLKTYAFGIIRNMILSNRSAFYKLHRRFGKQISTDEIDLPDLSEPDNLIDRIDEAVNTLDPYESGMIKLYAENGFNCDSIARATGIHKVAVNRVVNATKQKLKSRIYAHV